MKHAAIARFRQRIREDTPLAGFWLTLGTPAIADIAAGLGLDWIVIDAPDGHPDGPFIGECVRAGRNSDTVALLHIHAATPSLVRTALDSGADGILISANSLSEIAHASQQAAETGPLPPYRSVSASTTRPLVFAAPAAPSREMIEQLLAMEYLDAIALPAATLLQDGNAAWPPGRSKIAGLAHSPSDLQPLVSSGITLICIGSDSSVLHQELGNALDVAHEPTNVLPVLPAARGFAL